jgi:hypothetical protein
MFGAMQRDRTRQLKYAKAGEKEKPRRQEGKKIGKETAARKSQQVRQTQGIAC